MVTVEFESKTYAVKKDGHVVQVCAVVDQNHGDGCRILISPSLSVFQPVMEVQVI